jgi:uncharacterized Fe-S cluster-containing protein
MSMTLTKCKTKEHTAATGDCMFLLLDHHSQTYIRRRTDITRRRKKKKKGKKKNFFLNGSNSRVMLDPSPSIDRFLFFLTMLLAKLSGQTARHMYRHLVIYDDTERTTR